MGRRYRVVHELPEDLIEVYRDVFELDLPAFNGDDSWTLPMPARYVVGTDGVVRWAAVNADYTVRPDPEDTLRALRDLGDAEE